MALEIQIVSDLHLEFHAHKKVFNILKPSAKILALLGDICCVSCDDDFEVFKRFILEILPSFDHIIMVAGNHEHYYNPSKKSILPTKNNTLEATHIKIKTFFKATSKKLHYLNNNIMNLTVKNKKYTIVGTTLWSYIPKDQQERVQGIMSDYQYIYIHDPKTKKIRSLQAADVTNMFNKNYRYIKSQIVKATANKSSVILFTHHKPYIDKTYDVNGFDPAYMSDCSEIIKSPLVLCAWGHTHISEKFKLNGVDMYSNPRGYPRQKTYFNRSAVVKL